MTEHTVGVCGLGNMGMQIARRVAAVHPGPCFDIDPRARTLADGHGLEPTETLGDLAACDIILLSLPHAQISKAIVDELAEIVEPGTLVVETSTVAPSDITAMSTALAARGARFLDAAIISGVPAMAAGESTMLVGSEEVPCGDPLRDVLDALCSKITWTGSLGSAMAMKVIHNAVAHATMVTLAEARAMGVPYGITESMLVEMLRGEEAGLMRPLLHRLGERVPVGDFEGGMSLAAARKDSVLALEMAAEHRIPLFSIGASHTAYETAVGRFDGRDDYAVIAELWSGTDVDR